MTPSFVISVHGWLAFSLALGILVPINIAALGAGYIIGTHVCQRFNKTVFGIHVRHLLTRYSPSKFFDEDFERSPVL